MAMKKYCEYRKQELVPLTHSSKICGRIICLILLLCVFIQESAYSETYSYSLDALDEYCARWSRYYESKELDYVCDYMLSDDSKDLQTVYITYNANEKSKNYSSGLVPARTLVSLSIIPKDLVYLFHFYSDEKKGELESLELYGEDADGNEKRVVPGLLSRDSDYGMWLVEFTASELFDIIYAKEVYAVATINGEFKMTKISEAETEYLYDMIDWASGASLYANTNSPKYMDSSFLPHSTFAKPADVSHGLTGYSFRDDVDGMNKAAASVFYVEVFDENLTQIGTASGFVAFDEHLFVTNQHVIDGAAFLRITDDTKEENRYILNQVVASDKNQDIAILLFPDGNKYDALKLNINEDFQRGQSIVAIGSPEGLKNTLSKGDISGIRYEDGITYIQISASISNGSSGGALFDNNGKVIGVTSSGYIKGQNLNFAISIKSAQDLYARWNKSNYEILGSEKSWNLSGSSIDDY